MKNIKMAIETITPAIATQMLKKNNKNRSLRERVVTRLVKTINEGQWKINADAIRFAIDGTLVDGQHRLSAVVVSKKPIQSLVVRGLPLDVVDTIDIGNMRSLGNHLQMAGYKGAVFALAAAVGICLDFRKGQYVDYKEKTSPQEMLGFIKQHKRILKSAEIFTNTEHEDFQKLLPQSVSIATHYLFTEIDRDKGESFFHHLVKGENLGKASPILKLRNELIAMRTQSKRSGISRRIFLHYMTTAFQAYLDDKHIDSLPEHKPADKVLLPRAK